MNRRFGLNGNLALTPVDCWSGARFPIPIQEIRSRYCWPKIQKDLLPKVSGLDFGRSWLTINDLGTENNFHVLFVARCFS
jgi:hypothetical protein